MTGQLEHIGYLGVALFVCIEGFGIPAPGQTALIVAAAYAGNGHLNFAAVVAVALLGTIAGDNLGYLIGRTAGRRAVLRYGRYVRLTAARLDRVEEFVHRRGPAVIPVARFVEGLRQLNGIVCGSTGLPWRRFASFDAIGAVAWVGVWSAAGYFAGSHLDALEASLRRNLWLGIGAIVLLIVAYGVFHRSRKRRREMDEV